MEDNPIRGNSGSSVAQSDFACPDLLGHAMYERSGSQAGAGRMSVHPLQGGEASSEGDRKKAWSETAVHHGASEKAGGKRTDRTKF